MCYLLMSASKPFFSVISVVVLEDRIPLSLSSRTNLQVLVLVLALKMLVLVLILEPLEYNTGSTG